MTYQQVLENARTCIGPYCKACNDCNGKVCRNTMPGPGAKGEGTGFIRNAEKWRDICDNMDTICENSQVDTSFTLFGRTFEIPAFAAPVGAMRLHYGDKYDDLTYNDILVRACANAGILAFTGDGTDPKVVEGAAAALKGNGGCGVPTIKPWDMDTIREKFALVQEAEPFAIAMDIDAAGLPFLQGLTPPAGSKSVQELSEIIRYAGMPFIVKGIMTARPALSATAKPAATRSPAPAPKRPAAALSATLTPGRRSASTWTPSARMNRSIRLWSCSAPCTAIRFSRPRSAR